MRQDVLERLNFLRTQVRGAERAFMGSGHVLALQIELDRFQLSYSSHPMVLRSVSELRGAVSEFITSKINGRLQGADGNPQSAGVWLCLNRLEQSIRSIASFGETNDAVAAAAPRITVAA